jgi:hypothetical protein
MHFWIVVSFQFALHVYTQLIEAGQKYGIQHAGYYAMRALRVERFFAFWGQDLDTTTTPLECGRSWRVKFGVCLHTDIIVFGIIIIIVVAAVVMTYGKILFCINTET